MKKKDPGGKKMTEESRQFCITYNRVNKDPEMEMELKKGGLLMLEYRGIYACVIGDSWSALCSFCVKVE